MTKSPVSKQQGFTLIEVMVAVAIIGVALPALIMSLLKQVDSIAYVRDKLEAQLVAENIMTELRIRNELTGEIPKKENGEKPMGERDWLWETDFKEYPQEELKGVFAIEIKVWLKDEGNDDPTREAKPQAIFYGALFKSEKVPIKVPKPENAPGQKSKASGSGSSGSGSLQGSQQTGGSGASGSNTNSQGSGG
ncbi:MAG: type II secretion system minor pseudopilin GspI [Cellvibrionales bacterium]|nr:type II secretion system minor pseudopilin GspI [Cellvibrionales bacterium]